MPSVNDDRQDLQARIDAAGKPGGNRVVDLLGREYQIHGGLNLASGIRIVNGRLRCFVEVGAYGATVYGQNLSDVILDDVAFVQDSSVPSDNVPISDASNTTPIVLTTPAPHGLPIGRPRQVVVSNVTGNAAANGAKTGVALDATRVELENTAGNGLYLGGGTFTWDGRAHRQLVIRSSSDILVERCYFDGCNEQSLRLEGIKGGTVSRCGFYKSNGDSLATPKNAYDDYGAIACFNCAMLLAHSNVFQLGGTGISLYGGTNCGITGNYIGSDPANQSSMGIYCLTSIDGLIIGQNIVEDAAAEGIALVSTQPDHSAANVSIMQNVIKDCTYGIFIGRYTRSAAVAGNSGRISVPSSTGNAVVNNAAGNPLVQVFANPISGTPN